MEPSTFCIDISVTTNHWFLLLPSPKSKALLSRVISRMSISWYGKTQAPVAFWAHPGCENSDPSNGVYPRIPANETFPFPSKLGRHRSLLTLPCNKSSNPNYNCTRSVDQNRGMLANLNLQNWSLHLLPKKNLRLWRGGNKKCTNSCYGCQNGVFFAGFHAGFDTSVRHPTYLNATAPGWFDKLIDLNEKAMRTTAKPTALPSQHQLVTLACKTSSLKMEKQIPDVILSIRIHPIHRSFQQTVIFPEKNNAMLVL